MKIKDMDIQEHNKDKMEKKKEQKKPSTPLNYSEKRDFDPRPESERIITEERKQGFLTKVREAPPNAVVNIYFAPPECYDVAPTLHEIASTVHSILPRGSKEDITQLFIEHLSFNDSQIQELEKVTRDQFCWEQRIYRITASRFREVHKNINL